VIHSWSSGSETITYHNTDIPYIDLIVPIHLEQYLRSFVDRGLDVSSVDPPNPSLAKITQHRFPLKSRFWYAELTRSVYRAVSVDNLPRRWLMMFCILEIYEHSFIVDDKHDIYCLDVCVRNKYDIHCILFRCRLILLTYL
jgi:hypothetical protein